MPLFQNFFARIVATKDALKIRENIRALRIETLNNIYFFIYNDYAYRCNLRFLMFINLAFLTVGFAARH